MEFNDLVEAFQKLDTSIKRKELVDNLARLIKKMKKKVLTKME